ncbi:MAG: ribosome biogenesis GTPase Der [Opitutales bacterium]
MDHTRSVALVGCPNVGKSRLFNRLVGRRISIVHDQPGVTRDVITAEVGDSFLLMDTGGISMASANTPQAIAEAMEEQVDFAIQAATLVVFVTDASRGWTGADADIAEKLRRYGKKALLVVNKVDTQKHESVLDEFYASGFGNPMGISAEHGRGVDALYDEIESILGPKPECESVESAELRIKFCLVGRPNVGKSSLCNRLLQSKRLIVSDVAGTTRESVTSDIDYKTPEGETWAFRLVDTAGLRSQKKMDSSLEYFSSLRSESSIEASDVVFQVVDAMTGVTKLDKKVAGEVLAMGKPLIIVVNKWDYAQKLFKRDPIQGYETVEDFREAFEKAVRKELFFLPKSPIIFTSALTDFAVDALFKEARGIYERAHQELSTSKINKVLHDLMQAREPKSEGGKRFKVYYALQVGRNPFRIRLFCNQEYRLEENYERYLKAGFQRAFDFDGCPIVFDLRGKPKRDLKKATPSD